MSFISVRFAYLLSMNLGIGFPTKTFKVVGQGTNLCLSIIFYILLKLYIFAEVSEIHKPHWVGK